MAKAKKTRYVDVANPSMVVECPNCGMSTARFIDHCRNCGYKLWPSGEMASAAFRAWQAEDPARAEVSRFDLQLPVHLDDVIDYEARAHTLGIHLFPSSNWPFIICFGILFLALGAIPFAGEVRITLAVIGGIIFLTGVVGWVLVEDVRMFPAEDSAAGEAHH